MAIVNGTPYAEILNASDGVTNASDTIFGNGGNDTIFGLGGNDFIWGGTGADTIDGGSGVNTAMYSDSTVAVTVNLDSGTGSYGTAAGDTLINIQNLAGSDYNDWLIGNDGSNMLSGLLGADILKGGGGSDNLYGDSGNDILQGGAGADAMNGGEGIDTANYASSAQGVSVWLGAQMAFGGDAQGDTFIYVENVTGSAYHDDLQGHSGANVLSGGQGNDTIWGGDGADTLQGGDGSDTVEYAGSDAGVTVSLLTQTASGGDANGDVLSSFENIIGSSHNDTLEGDNGENRIEGGGDNDTIRGWNGNDILIGGSGADNLFGGFGSDRVEYSGSAEGVTVSLLSNSGSDGDAEDDTFSSIEDVTGSSHDDELHGNDVENTLLGENGNDVLKGYGGEDHLEGRADNDVLHGMDENDDLFGGGGNDTLVGGTGLDLMGGGDGNDTYHVDNAGDFIDEDGGEGLDEVRASVSYTLTAGADVETLRTNDDDGTAAIDLTGNTSGNQIIGNDGGNEINGGGGVDQLVGRGGNDLYFVDGDDSISENGGQGLDEARASMSFTLTAGADVEILRTTNDAGVAAIDLTGNASGNIIRGNNGNNVINGGDGDDELTGLGGPDSFLFNTPLDAATNVDVVADFLVGTDRIFLENMIFAALSPGDLAAGRFVIGAAAQDADDNIIYNSSTGALLYDADGTGASAAIQFATLSTGLALTHNDFLVV